MLLEMRKFRMGLIQTADQLRFSYLAVIEGAKFILGDASVQVSSPWETPRGRSALPLPSGPQADADGTPLPPPASVEGALP